MIVVSGVMTDLALADFTAVEFPDVCEPFILPHARKPDRAPEIAGVERSLERGEFLCREGDRKSALHRLDSGVLCFTTRRASGPPEVIEMMFPGEFVGLGFLEHHIHSVMAVVPSRLTEFPISAIGEFCNVSAEVRDRQSLQTEREFAARRHELANGLSDRTLRRVAAFLSAMYHMNRSEGRNPAYIAEFLKTGDVASFLDMDVAALAEALSDLKQRGLVERAENGGLMLLDPDALELLSESD